MDPYMKGFLDKYDGNFTSEWDLPKPNEEAAYKSLAKYGKDILPMDDQQIRDMNLAWEMTRKHFSVYMMDSHVVDYATAKQKMDMSTSTGAPFNVLHKTKQELFEQDPEIDQFLQDDWETFGHDPMWTCLFTNSVKEEVRAKEKIKENSLRTFLAGGVDAVVHGTRLFVDMNEKFYASHLKSASAVGLSPYKGNWDRLYQKLKTFNKGYALDESQYDSSLREFLMWACCWLRWHMLAVEDRTSENLLRFRTYYRNLIYTLVIGPDGTIVMKKGGNPSGSCNTITDNTLILYALLSYAWVRTAPEHMRNLVDFELHTAKCLVGDDNTWTVSDEAHEWFNASTVIAEWKRIGITTTTDSMKPRKPAELDFLSAHTVFLRGMAVPVYSREKLMTSLLYAPYLHHTPATTLERTAAMLSVGWTDLPFRTFCRELIAWLLAEFDSTLHDDERWIMAKHQIADDMRLEQLFLGKTNAVGYSMEDLKRENDVFLLYPQSYPGTGVKLKKPGKNPMNAAKPKTGGAKPQRKRKQQQKGKKKVVVAVNRRQRRGPRNRRTRKGGGGASGVGSTKTFQRQKRTCTIQEDEYVEEIIGTNGFANKSYAINPGNSVLFPWLSKQAAQWEKYHFNSLEFYYKREVSEFATQGQAGKIIMGVDFDASDAPPTSKRQIEDTDPHVDGMPCENINLRLKQSDMHGLLKTLYVRNAGANSLALGDLKTYDIGNLNVATQGMAGGGPSAIIGELRVKYSVTFSVPVLESDSQIKNTMLAAYRRDVDQIMTDGEFEAINFDVGIYNGIKAVESGGEITLPKGLYLVTTNADFACDGGGQVDYVLQHRFGGVILNQVSFTAAGGGSNADLQGLSLTTAVLSDGVSDLQAMGFILAAGSTTRTVPRAYITILALASG